MKSLLNHRYLFWVLLSLPALEMLARLSSDDPHVIHQILSPSGEFAALFMIIAMMITPLTMLFKGWRGPRWLMKRRRYLGVAAFFYAALHTMLYLIDHRAVAFSLAEISKLFIWTGWLAFLILVPLAVTSSDGWVRKLGPAWKTLHRFVYGAAIVTLLHWTASTGWSGLGPALVLFVPLALLEAFRLFSNQRRRRLRSTV